MNEVNWGLNIEINCCWSATEVSKLLEKLLEAVDPANLPKILPPVHVYQDSIDLAPGESIAGWQAKKISSSKEYFMTKIEF